MLFPISVDPPVDPLPLDEEYVSFAGLVLSSTAGETCEALHGELAWIESAEQNIAVLQACNATGAEACRIGIELPYESWDSGTPVTYTNWNVRAYGGGDLFGYMRSNHDGSWWGIPGTWDDAGEGEVNFVCRVPVGQEIPDALTRVPVPKVSG